MASDKKVILIFTPCADPALCAAASPALSKLVQKGAVLPLNAQGDPKAQAASGNVSGGESLWDAASRKGFVVTDIKSAFDMVVLDAAADLNSVEQAVASALEVADRATLVVLVAAKQAVFYGPGIAKGTAIEKPLAPASVAATVSYVADFPVPAQCEAAVAYEVLRDRDYKLNEMLKYKESVANMELALERKSRQPWDKHDCA